MRQFIITIIFFIVPTCAGLIQDNQTFDLSDSDVQENLSLYQTQLAPLNSWLEKWRAREIKSTPLSSDVESLLNQVFEQEPKYFNGDYVTIGISDVDFDIDFQEIQTPGDGLHDLKSHYEHYEIEGLNFFVRRNLEESRNFDCTLYNWTPSWFFKWIYGTKDLQVSLKKGFPDITIDTITLCRCPKEMNENTFFIRYCLGNRAYLNDLIVGPLKSDFSPYEFQKIDEV